MYGTLMVNLKIFFLKLVVWRVLRRKLSHFSRFGKKDGDALSATDCDTSLSNFKLVRVLKFTLHLYVAICLKTELL